jgi:flagellar hook-basal body complex protein FliE
MTSSLNPMASALDALQSMATQAAGGASGAAQPSSAIAGAGGFADVLRGSLERISGAQTKAVGESQAFELGAPNVSLNDVMVDMQKANVGFQFGLQVRNKLVTAYNEIMQMQV